MDPASLIAAALSLAAAYSLVALGFVLVLSMTGAVNFAQGDLVVAGGFMAVAVLAIIPDGPWMMPLVVLPLTLLVMAVGGVAFGALAYLPLARRSAPTIFLASIAVAMMIQNGLLGLFGPAPRSTPPLLSGGPVDLPGFSLDRQTLAVLVVAGGLLLAAGLILTRTRFGLRLRAVAEDSDMAAAMGVPVAVVRLATFALAAALAGAAGLMLAHQFFLTPADGAGFMLKAYIAATLGGWGRLSGAIMGACVIALLETAGAALLGFVAAEALLYGLVIVLLVVRPGGLLGEKSGERP
ncbi:MAG: branched-chain amino acid ABC transporter permease [Alphaproteobacteria bacterium]